jgi:hypothetical protein
MGGIESVGRRRFEEDGRPRGFATKRAVERRIDATDARGGGSRGEKDDRVFSDG